MSIESAKKELESAKRAVEAMKNAESFDIFDEEWRDFLNCLEKVWVKTERGCQHIKNSFQPWQGRYSALRRKDMLLRYLKQARDADNHSIQPVAEYKAANRTLDFINAKGGQIKNLVIEGGQIVHYEGDPLVVRNNPASIQAIRVKNSGNWYNPPTSHLNKKVSSLHPVHLAELGVQFYEAFINDTESTFFS
ncbi:hypothetical protein TERTU_0535 [Teredinibacter turnerae T7901]|uniref:Uncharacterized protein n=1 Tax=Teredinibacter turnerae (strain ATCC 39867 / T7901) TaxID=377629 RepID=C5BN36_TERTT|nr:hypothetical protein [Teredinibacter turnerae]ACR11423.1 hypothetical protein TERTU_0535 [Teredinibacter turnerae T7901]